MRKIVILNLLATLLLATGYAQEPASLLPGGTTGAVKAQGAFYSDSMFYTPVRLSKPAFGNKWYPKRKGALFTKFTAGTDTSLIYWDGANYKRVMMWEDFYIDTTAAAGTVTDVGAGDLSPLFTTTTSNPTSTPVINFALSNTVQYRVFGRKASGSGAPSYLYPDSSLIPDLHSQDYYDNRYVQIGGAYANQSLSNLSSVSINTSLLPGTTNSIDLGSSSKTFRNIYLPSGPDGVVYQGANTFIHTFKLTGTDGDNLFFGNGAGNRTMTGSTGLQGSYNLGVGSASLSQLTTGFRNTALGIYAMQNNTTGQGNTATGQNSLTTNTSGERNVATGMRSMALNTSGFANVMLGFDAGFGNTTGDHNTAVGLDALYWSNGSHNTALGDSTFWGIYNTQKHMGYKNTAIGSRAGYHLGDTYPNYASIFDTAVTFIGANSSRDSSVLYTTSLQNSTAIGYNSRVFASNQISFGDENITTNIFRGNVGIGTRTPGSALTIGSNAFTINSSGVVGNGTWQGSIINYAYLGTGGGGATKFLREDNTWQTVSGGGGSQDLASVTALGNTTSSGIILTGGSSELGIEDGGTETMYIGAESGTGYMTFRSTVNSNITVMNQSLLTAARTLTIPDASGTIALTSQLLTYPSAGIVVSTGSAWGTSITDNSSNWNTAYTDRLKWDGGSTGLNAATGRTSLGGTTVGQNFFTLANPSAVTFPKINADNTVTARSASNLRSDLGLGDFATTNFTSPVDVSGFWNFRGDLAMGTVGHTGSFYSGGLGTDQSYDLPNQSGTMALTVDISNAISTAISGTANELAYFTGPSSIANLPIATYPNLTEVSYVKGVTSAIQTQLSGKQPLDADLTTIAGLTATTDNFLVAVSSAWASRTPSQVRTTLGLVVGTDVQAYDADLTAWAGISPSANIQSFNSAANYAAARVLLLPSISSNSLKFLRVNAGETDVEWAAGGGGGGSMATLSDVTLTSVASGDMLRYNGSAWVNRTASQTRTDLSLVPGTDIQAYDGDLNTIAGLTATTDNFIVSVSSAWASRTPAQVKTTLSLDNVDNTSDATKNSATATLTNKRITARTGTTTSSATPTINTDNIDYYSITALAANITSFTTNLSGTPSDGDRLWISIKDNGTARTIAWGSSFSGSLLPVTTVASTRLDVFLTWDAATSKWYCIAVQ